MDFFEGTEKRITLSSNINLLNVDIETWKILLEKTGCTILSVIQNNLYIFFLLSESSFLVSENWFMLKTCGKTEPLKIINNMFHIEIDNFMYSHSKFLRAIEQYYPYNNVDDEIEHIKNIFCNNNKINELIYCDNDDYFYCSFGKPEKYYELTSRNFTWNDDDGLYNLIMTNYSGVIIDFKQFDPVGYSLNALIQNIYITIHVTPQHEFKYISIETNMNNYNIFFNNIIKITSMQNYKIFNN